MIYLRVGGVADHLSGGHKMLSVEALRDIRGGSYPTREHYFALYGFNPPDDATYEEWVRLILEDQSRERVDGFAEHARELVSGVNRGHTKEVAHAMVHGHHPYLLNELMLALMEAMGKRFGDGMDGRISPILLDMIKRGRID
jgi:hypothetical protein